VPGQLAPVLRATILDSMSRAALSADILAESTTRCFLLQGSYSRSRAADHIGFLSPSTSEVRVSTRRRCSDSSEQTTSTSRIAPLFSAAILDQESRVNAIGVDALHDYVQTRLQLLLGQVVRHCVAGEPKWVR
jgi:hypothetical protein